MLKRWKREEEEDMSIRPTNEYQNLTYYAPWSDYWLSTWKGLEKRLGSLNAATVIDFVMELRYQLHHYASCIYHMVYELGIDSRSVQSDKTGTKDITNMVEKFKISPATNNVFIAPMNTAETAIVALERTIQFIDQLLWNVSRTKENTANRKTALEALSMATFIKDEILPCWSKNMLDRMNTERVTIQQAAQGQTKPRKIKIEVLALSVRGTTGFSSNADQKKKIYPMNLIEMSTTWLVDSKYQIMGNTDKNKEEDHSGKLVRKILEFLFVSKEQGLRAEKDKDNFFRKCIWNTQLLGNTWSILLDTRAYPLSSATSYPFRLTLEFPSIIPIASSSSSSSSVSLPPLALDLSEMPMTEGDEEPTTLTLDLSSSFSRPIGEEIKTFPSPNRVSSPALYPTNKVSSPSLYPTNKTPSPVLYPITSPAKLKTPSPSKMLYPKLATSSPDRLPPPDLGFMYEDEEDLERGNNNNKRRTMEEENDNEWETVDDKKATRMIRSYLWVGVWAGVARDMSSVMEIGLNHNDQAFLAYLQQHLHVDYQFKWDSAFCFIVPVQYRDGISADFRRRYVIIKGTRAQRLQNAQELTQIMSQFQEVTKQYNRDNPADSRARLSVMRLDEYFDEQERNRSTTVYASPPVLLSERNSNSPVFNDNYKRYFHMNTRVPELIDFNSDLYLMQPGRGIHDLAHMFQLRLEADRWFSLQMISIRPPDDQLKDHDNITREPFAKQHNRR